MNNDFLKKIIAERGARIELIVLTNENGEDGYYYVFMREAEYQKFMEKANSGQQVRIQDYGTILHYGDGDTPPEDIQKKFSELIEK
jgi:hypothetical protein